MHMCFTAYACSNFALSHGPKQITWPRFKEWRNRPHLWMEEVAKSHCKKARTEWEESVTVSYATGAMRNYDVPGTMPVTHLFHLAPCCSELPWHHDKQKDLRLSCKMCVGDGCRRRSQALWRWCGLVTRMSSTPSSELKWVGSHDLQAFFSQHYTADIL